MLIFGEDEMGMKCTEFRVRSSEFRVGQEADESGGSAFQYCEGKKKAL